MNLENMMCSRCHKRMAVIYMTRIEDGKVINEGLCPKCAKELGLKPVDDIMSKMGITDDELDAFTDQLTETLENTDEGELFRQVSSMPIPFMQNFMNPGAGPGGDITPPRPAGEKPPERPVATPEKKPAYKFLDNFCENLTQRARDGKLDAIVGRDREIYRVVQILNRRTKNNPCLIGSLAWAKPPSPRASPSGLRTGRFPPSSSARRSTCWISPAWWRAPSSGASLKAA